MIILQIIRFDLFVFGAGPYGEETVRFLVQNSIVPESIIVTNTSDNVKEILGIQVKGITEIEKVSAHDICLIAVKGTEKCKIQHDLYRCGFTYLIPLY